jgi:phosphatidylinositol alpha-1,6-mannosyltransferase
MRWGLPVVASIHDAGGEINVDGSTGYNVNLDRRDELVDRLVHLLREDTIAREFGQNAQARWKEHFSMGAFRSRFLAVTRDFFT